MGWGCYKHEMDAGSEHWKEAVEQACPPPYESWGQRDQEVCPECWIELKSERDDLLAALESIAEFGCEDSCISNHSIKARERGACDCSKSTALDAIAKTRRKATWLNTENR